MTAKRTPIRRRPHLQITPLAIRAYRLMREARQQYICELTGLRSREEPWRHCRACEERWRQHDILYDDLCLKPWEYPLGPEILRALETATKGDNFAFIGNCCNYATKCCLKGTSKNFSRQVAANLTR